MVRNTSDAKATSVREILPVLASEHAMIQGSSPWLYWFFIEQTGTHMSTNDERLCREQAISDLDKLITYHTERTYFCISVTWSFDDHRAAIKTLKAVRDHLERCYEIRSCD